MTAWPSLPLQPLARNSATELGHVNAAEPQPHTEHEPRTATSQVSVYPFTYCSYHFPHRETQQPSNYGTLELFTSLLL